jgi:hypothetical protein
VERIGNTSCFALPGFSAMALIGLDLEGMSSVRPALRAR